MSAFEGKRARCVHCGLKITWVDASKGPPVVELQDVVSGWHHQYGAFDPRVLRYCGINDRPQVFRETMANPKPGSIRDAGLKGRINHGWRRLLYRDSDTGSVTAE